MNRWLLGPWVGEFGWEILHWQGHLRWLADQNPRVRLTVACETGHEYFYEDFAHDFLLMDCSEHGKNGPSNAGYVRQAKLAGFDRTVSPEDVAGLPQRFVRLGAGVVGEPFDLMVHARNTSKGGDDHKNWPKKNWDELVSRLVADGFRVGSFGSRGGSLCPSVAIDIRHDSLKNICGSIATSRLAIGTTSGPMELATLAGIPTAVWGDRVGEEKKKWACTIFNSKYKWLSSHWQPSVDEVYSGVMEALK